MYNRTLFSNSGKFQKQVPMPVQAHRANGPAPHGAVRQGRLLLQHKRQCQHQRQHPRRESGGVLLQHRNPQKSLSFRGRDSFRALRVRIRGHGFGRAARLPGSMIAAKSVSLLLAKSVWNQNPLPLLAAWCPPPCTNANSTSSNFAWSASFRSLSTATISSAVWRQRTRGQHAPWV